jgi:hypothetical protein
MQVTAISTPAAPNWRWRITNYACEMVEESLTTFPTVAAAIAAGTRRLRAMNVTDRSVPPPRFQRSTSHQRGR